MNNKVETNQPRAQEPPAFAERQYEYLLALVYRYPDVFKHQSSTDIAFLISKKISEEMFGSRR
jgi:hypothetical protein